MSVLGDPRDPVSSRQLGWVHEPWPVPPQPGDTLRGCTAGPWAPPPEASGPESRRPRFACSSAQVGSGRVGWGAPLALHRGRPRAAVHLRGHGPQGGPRGSPQLHTLQRRRGGREIGGVPRAKRAGWACRTGCGWKGGATPQSSPDVRLGAGARGRPPPSGRGAEENGGREEGGPVSESWAAQLVRQGGR